MSSSSIFLPDGTRWPRPSLESDDEHGIGWKLRHAREHLTTEDLLEAAFIVSAYGYLVVDVTQKRRNEICSGIQRELT